MKWINSCLDIISDMWWYLSTDMCKISHVCKQELMSRRRSMQLVSITIQITSRILKTKYVMRKFTFNQFHGWTSNYIWWWLY